MPNEKMLEAQHLVKKAKKDIQQSVEDILALDETVKKHRNALEQECERAVKNFETETWISFERFCKELPEVVTKEIKYLDMRVAELRADMKHKDRKTKLEYVNKIQDIEDEKIVVCTSQYAKSQIKMAKSRVEKAIEDYKAKLDLFITKSFYTQKKYYIISVPKNPEGFYVPELTNGERVVWNHINLRGHFKLGDSIDKYFDSHNYLLNKALDKLTRYGMVYRIEIENDVYFVLPGESITVKLDVWIEDKAFSNEKIPKATPICFTKQVGEAVEYKNHIHFINNFYGAEEYKKEQMCVMAREREMKKQKHKKITKRIVTLSIILLLCLIGLLIAYFVRLKQTEIKAVNEIKNNKIEESIKMLLESGVPVEITYNFDGGVLSTVSSPTYGSILSLDTSIVPITTENTDDTKEENKVCVYNKISDFYGLPIPEKSGYEFCEWAFVDYSYKIGDIFKLEIKATWVESEYTITFDDVKAQEILVTYDYNYSGSMDSTVTLSDGETLIYPSIPERNGYIFTGWYTDSACTAKYNFTGEISRNITLYAKWVEMSMEDVGSEIQIDPGKYKSSSDAYTISTRGTSSTSQKHIYLVAEKPGTHYIYFKNSTSYPSCYLQIYNLTTETMISTKSAVSSTTYKYFEFICEEGDIIVISVYSGSTYSSSTAYLYFEKFDSVTSSAVASIRVLMYDDNATCTEMVTFNKQYTLPVATRKGYSFLGWYNGEVKIESGIWSISSDVTLVPKWQASGNTIVLDANGGTVSEKYVAVTYSKEYTLPTPERTGYTFDGWYSGEIKYENSTWYDIEDITLVAKWIANEYTVTFDDVKAQEIFVTYDYNYRGSIDSTVTLSDGEILTYPSIPERNGYIFTGWYTDSACTAKYNFTGEISRDITLYAKWDEMSMEDVGSEMQIDPSKYKSSSDAYTISTSGTSSISQKHIYLVAEKSGTHYIYFKSSSSYNGYSLQIYNLTAGTTIRSGATVTSTSYNYCKFICEEGDIIVISLYCSYNRTADFYFEKFDSVTSSAVAATSGSIADIEKIKDNIVITYDYNYSDSDPTTVTLTNGQILNYPTVPTRNDYAFVGWYTDSNCTMRYNFKDTIIEDITLYAKWYPMQFEHDTWEYVDIAKYNSLSSKKTINIASSSGSKPDYYSFTCYTSGTYTFYSEYTSGDFYINVYNATQGIAIIDEYNLYDKIPEKSASFTANAGDVIYISLYKYSSIDAAASGAFYVENASYPVSTAIVKYKEFSYNESSTVSTTVTFGNMVTLPVPVRTGYTFMGWYNGETKVEDTWNIASDVTLTAKWKVTENTITLDANGGAVSENYVAVTYDQEYTLPTPTRTGYTFDGWYSEEVKYESGTWLEKNDVTLAAKWTANKYSITFEDAKYRDITVTFDNNHTDAGSTNITFSGGDILSYPDVPERSGYVFTGWYTDSECTTRYTFTGTISDDMTLYAGWKAQKTESVYGNTIINPSMYATSSGAYSISAEDTSSTSQKYIYLTANESGTHTIYYRNSSSSYSYYTYIGITNLTTGETIKTTSYCSSTSYTYITFTCSVGDVIAINIYRYSTSYASYYGTAYFYFSGFSDLTSTAVADIADTFSRDIMYGNEYTLPVLSRPGYTFLGWYNGETKIESGEWNIASDVTLTPKWEENT